MGRIAKQPASALLQAESFPAQDWWFCHCGAQVGAWNVTGKEH
jgi:hypothetical protein